MPGAILFDLDDTLFDHHGASRAALARVHASHVAADRIDFDAFAAHHAHFLEELHLEVLAGRLGLDEARQERFRRVFGALGVPLTDDEAGRAAAEYRLGYLDARRPVPGAIALLRALHTRAPIGIVSNNLRDEQQEKLEVCGLQPFVTALVVSGDTGVSKPDPAIFRIALARMGVSAGDAVMIGDAWDADIEGAARAGIRAIWFNPNRRPRPDEREGVGELHALEPAEQVARSLLEAMSTR
ncbi:MAG TPA: HAD-IA family hydrolase [Vicinamibacterales bacterium]|nr:HAD-IA family hydrolase [Vicinamibacterales bacterium]